MRLKYYCTIFDELVKRNSFISDILYRDLRHLNLSTQKNEI